jgi:hypothetical protein
LKANLILLTGIALTLLGYYGSRYLYILKPNVLKLALVHVIPAMGAILVTGNADTLLDFYGYLLKPWMGVWTGTEIVNVFNRYLLLWIPFYLAACALVYLMRVKRGFPFFGDTPESS